MQSRSVSLRAIASAGCIAFLLSLSLPIAVASAAPDPTALARADSLYARQAWSEAAVAYQPLVEELQDDGLRWYRYGTSLLQSGRYPEAVSALTRAEAIGHHPSAMYNLACALTKLQRQDEAIEWLVKATAAGFNQLAQLESDEDLAPLRSHSRWDELRAAVDKNARPCAHDDRYRELDFWIGDWEVRTAQGQPAGRSHVEPILGSCVIFENWTGFLGMSGKSFNFIDPVTRRWKQTWVDDKGDVHEYTGEFIDGAMRYRREAREASGGVILHRMSLFDLEPGHVRQLGERSQDGGKTWSIQYDLHYHRDPGP